MSFQVVDSRSEDILFKHKEKQQCEEFWNELWEEDSTTAIYSTVEEVNKNTK